MLTQGDNLLRQALENSFLFTLHLDWAGYNPCAARQCLPSSFQQAYHRLGNPDLNV